MTLEVAATNGKEAAVLLWDVAHFYDGINVKRLTQDVVKFNFPLAVASLALQTHAGTRSLRVNSCFSKPIEQVGRGILAGCSSSTSFARLFLLEPLGATGARQAGDAVVQGFEPKPPLAAAGVRQAGGAVVHGVRTETTPRGSGGAGGHQCRGTRRRCGPNHHGLVCARCVGTGGQRGTVLRGTCHRAWVYDFEEVDRHSDKYANRPQYCQRSGQSGVHSQRGEVR